MTEAADEVVALATKEAARLEHPVVDAEHLLLGLAQVRGIASVVLRNAGADVDQLRGLIQDRAEFTPVSLAQQVKGLFRRQSEDVQRPFTPELERIVRRADEAARELGHDRVGTEHLLWSLVQECSGLARLLITSLDLTPERARRQILEMMHVVSEGAPRRAEVKRPKRPRTPALDAFGTDWTEAARAGRLPRLLRRPAESARLKEILLRLYADNPLLVGPSGSGKTALVQSLAKEIALGHAPESLARKRVVALDPFLLVAGTRYRGQLEERLCAVLAEIRRTGDVILFLDDLQLLSHGRGGAGGDDAGAWVSASDVLRLLKPALDRDEVQIVAALLDRDEERVLASHPGLETHFQKVPVAPPDVETVAEILRKRRRALADHHGFEFSESALAAALDAARKDGGSRTLLVKALGALDAAGARQRRRAAPASEGAAPPPLTLPQLAADEATAH